MEALQVARRKFLDTPLGTTLRDWKNQFLESLDLQKGQLKALRLPTFIKWNAVLLNAWLRDRISQHAYTSLNETELRATRKSDKVFVFGSGYSLNDLSAAEWQTISEHDTLGFSGFVYQKWIPVDYYLMRGWVETLDGTFHWRKHTADFAQLLNENPYFQNAILIMQGEYLSQFCNVLIGYRLLKPGRRIFRFATQRTYGYPTDSLHKGLRHNTGTLYDVVNFAYAMGWTEIVLVGVDLYDSRYFWLKPDETLDFDKNTGLLIPAQQTDRKIKYDRTHNTARNGVVEGMGQWRDFMAANNVNLSVYNPRSLMTDVMPVYRCTQEL